MLTALFRSWTLFRQRVRVLDCVTQRPPPRGDPAGLAARAWLPGSLPAGPTPQSPLLMQRRDAGRPCPGRRPQLQAQAEGGVRPQRGPAARTRPCAPRWARALPSVQGEQRPPEPPERRRAGAVHPRGPVPEGRAERASRGYGQGQGGAGRGRGRGRGKVRSEEGTPLRQRPAAAQQSRGCREQVRTATCTD